jgi:hypothetical protein
MPPTLTSAMTYVTVVAPMQWRAVPADTFEERVRCCVLAALEAAANGEAIALAECRHRLEELIPAPRVS